ncbi:conserved hypothetical protein [Candidatus Terasakiella magnetica]|uniref:Uncharacterized protein n=1 Tax=Candidatus Terasakiella magnetica TaxID=1867952 RepID=A0A1C3RF92_9PROT|nr:hypothetical protein [Candidatus Terasakiella magnetica]SCA55928.1 conserved hypothetical protein [Candidatus Terasakiella magnetica]
MTAQFSNTIIYDGEFYDLIGIEGPELFHPSEYGMIPEMLHTACYAGFYCTFELTEDALKLRGLTLRDKNSNYVKIGDVEPMKDEYQASYENLDVTIPFSGQIRLAKDFIDELYVHMGFQAPSSYQTVFDVNIENGRIHDVIDRSKEMEELRKGPPEIKRTSSIANFVRRAFSLKMEKE